MQRYVSKELSHFVGNTTKNRTEDDQYDILVNKILKSGWLTYPPHKPNLPRSVSLDLSKSISTDSLINYQVICFCDILADDLAIHVKKYGNFGLSFKKEFLIEKGASPVFYVANESLVYNREIFAPDDFMDRIRLIQESKIVDRAIYFDTSIRALLDILIALDSMASVESDRFFRGWPDVEFKKRLSALSGFSELEIKSAENIFKCKPQAAKTIKMLTDFLINYIFSNIKCFDSKKEFTHSENYYMEREWRVGSNVEFSLSDVTRVFLPSKYATQFRKDLPDYTGQISFIDYM